MTTAVFRRLAATPVLTGVSCLCLSTAFTAALLIFAVVDAILLKPLPFTEPDRLVIVSLPHLNNPGSTRVAPQDYLDWSRVAGSVFDGIAAAGRTEAIGVREHSADTAVGVHVTSTISHTLGVTPRLGRWFSSDVATQGSAPEVVVSHRFWKRLFGDTPFTGLEEIRTSGGRSRIVGVMAPGFVYPLGLQPEPDVWIPYDPKPEERTRATPSISRYLTVIARLAPNQTPESARDYLVRSSLDLQREYPSDFADRNIRVIELRRQLFAGAEPWLLTLLSVAVALLILSAVNVAALMLIRSSRNAHDWAIRSALGAGRASIARLVLLDVAVLVGAAALLSIALGTLSMGLVTSALPPNLPRVSDVSFNVRVYAFGLLIVLALCLLCGLLPALRATSLATYRGSSASGGTRVLQHRRVIGSILTCEVALSAALLATTGLFVSSFVRVSSVDLGMDVSRLVAARISIDVARGETLAAIEERARSLPHVEAAALHQGSLPLSGGSAKATLSVDGRRLRSTPTSPVEAPELHAVSEHYFSTIRTRLDEGRLFTAADRAGATPVIILNSVAVRQYFGGASALGRNVNRRTVVGVVESVRHSGPEGALRPEVYIPIAQTQMRSADLIIRMDPRARAASVMNDLRSMLGDRRLVSTSFEDQYRSYLGERKLSAVVTSVLGIVGIIVTMVGVFSVTAFVAMTEIRGLAIRIAIGATPRQAAATLLRVTSTCALLGTVIGLLGAWIAAPTVATALFGQQPRDPLVFIGVALVCLSSAVGAALVPAYWSTRIDPFRVLSQSA